MIFYQVINNMSLRRVASSSSFLSSLASPTIKGSQLFLYFSASVAHILRISHGRDKIFRLIQSISELYKQCMLEYLEEFRIKAWPTSMKNAQLLVIAMKNGRKFFRLLRWVEEIGRVEDKLSRPPKTEIILKLLRHMIGVVYYFLDNIIWTINIGLLGEVGDDNSRLERAKDSLSFVRYFMRIIIFYITFNSKFDKEKNLRVDLLTYPNKEINFDSNGLDLTLSLIKARSKRRFQTLEMFINVFRIIMLSKSLKFPGTDKLSAVFYSACGVTSVALSLFKLLTHKSSPLITYNVVGKR
jgi:hypothetical protein